MYFGVGAKGPFLFASLQRGNLGAQASVEEPARGGRKHRGPRAAGGGHLRSQSLQLSGSVKAAACVVSCGGRVRKEGEPGCTCLPGETQVWGKVPREQGQI